MTQGIARFSLPFLIDGKRWDGSGKQTLRTADDCEVVMPAFDQAAHDVLTTLDRSLLVNTPLQEITAFLHRAGLNWRNDEYARRRLFIARLQMVLGYSEVAAEVEADWIAAILCAHGRMHDLVGVELGDPHIVDEWVRTEEAQVRAFPAGIVAHVLPGNVPSSAVLSIVRALVTKNVSVAKVASGDPLTAHSLAMSLIDIEPTHPVARAANIVYWPEGDELGADVVRRSDAVCAWGSSGAIEWARENTGTEAAFVPFGPKWSLGLVGADADIIDAATGLAHDVSAYDQEACFSTQRVFVERSVADEFVAALADALAHYEELLPPRRLGIDEHAHVNIARLEMLFDDGSATFAARRAAIVVGPPGPRTAPSTGRTILVHPVANLSEAYAFADRQVQTVAVAPWEIVVEHRDTLAMSGTCRFVDMGLSNFFRIGGTHDGMRPLQRLVRFVSTEMPARVHSKGMILPLDQTSLLENRRFKDFAF